VYRYPCAVLRNERGRCRGHAAIYVEVIGFVRVQVQTNEHGGRNLSESGDQEPDETLSPEEATEMERTAFVEAQAKQTNEHDNKQDNVATEGDNDVKFGAVEVGYHTSGIEDDHVDMFE